jgi:hypothetical protein
MPFRLSNARLDSPPGCDSPSLSGLSNGIFSTSLFRSGFRYHSGSPSGAVMTVFGPMRAMLPILIYTPEQAAEEYYTCAAANKELSCWYHAGVVASPAGILRKRRNFVLAKPANVDRSAGLKRDPQPRSRGREDKIIINPARLRAGVLWSFLAGRVWRSVLHRKATISL